MGKNNSNSDKNSQSKTLKPKLKRRRPCPFCLEKIDDINYKDQYKMKRFLSDRGKIIARRNSSVCAKHQRKLCIAVKKSRVIGLVPYAID